MTETWVKIKNSKGYEISNLGHVRRKIAVNLYKTLRGYKNREGYHLFAIVSSTGKRQQLLAHRLVAEAFLPHTERDWTVWHKDGNNLNNKVDNLEWVQVPDAKRRWYR